MHSVSEIKQASKHKTQPYEGSVLHSVAGVLWNADGVCQPVNGNCPNFLYGKL